MSAWRHIQTGTVWTTDRVSRGTRSDLRRHRSPVSYFR